MNRYTFIKFDANMNPSIFNHRYGVRADVRYDECGRYWIVSYADRHNKRVEYFARDLAYMWNDFKHALFIRKTIDDLEYIRATTAPIEAYNKWAERVYFNKTR